MKKLFLIPGIIIITIIIVLFVLVFNNSNVAQKSSDANSNAENNINKNLGGNFEEAFSKIIDEKMANRSYWEIIDDIINCERKYRNKDGTEGSSSYGQPETQNICSDYEGKSLTFVNVQITSEKGSYSIVETKYGINLNLPISGNLPSPIQISKKYTITGIVEKSNSLYFLNVNKME